MPKILDHEAYFWSKVVPTGFCWEWQGVPDGNGYGNIKQNRVAHKAHRRSYEYLVGPIPEGMLLDHLCRNTICVNPDHLEPVTPRENILRGFGTGARYARRDSCPRCGGMDYYTRQDGGRRCKRCVAAKSRAHRERIKGAPLRKWVPKAA